MQWPTKSFAWGQVAAAVGKAAPAIQPAATPFSRPIYRSLKRYFAR